MENKIYHNAGKVLNFQPKNVETGTKLIQWQTNTWQIYFLTKITTDIIVIEWQTI
jgi:hypothetical protein